jgi:lipoprotein-anchoring transpeptidase ErfK/SrfK
LAVLGGVAVVSGVGWAPETSETSAETVESAALAAPALRLPAVSVPQLPTDELAQAAAQAEEAAEDDASDDADDASVADEVADRTTVRAPTAAATRTRVPGTPCTTTARACADIGARKAWLIDDGRIVRGPVRIMVGDAVDPTPVGTFHVEWKDKEYTSREYLRQMPYSVFFADGGIAFHEGPLDTPSGGCIKLSHADAVAWFNFLEVGDEVQVVRSG